MGPVSKLSTYCSDTEDDDVAPTLVVLPTRPMRNRGSYTLHKSERCAHDNCPVSVVGVDA